MSQFSKEKVPASATLAAIAAFGSLTLPALGAPSAALTQTPPRSSAASPTTAPNNQVFAAAIEKARAFAFQNTHEPIGPLGKLAAAQLQVFGSAMGVPVEQLRNAKVADYGTFVMAVTNNWIYTADVAGNQALRPVSNLSLFSSGLTKQTEPLTSPVRVDSLTELSQKLAGTLGCDHDQSLAEKVVKREILTSRLCAANSLQFYEGRFLIRLCTKDNLSYFQVMCDHNYRPIRVETNVQTQEALHLSELLFKSAESSSLQLRQLRDGTSQMTLGTFSSPMEARFPEDAYSAEGETFLNSTISRKNPFTSGDFDTSNFNFLDVEAHRRSQDYKSNAYRWWKLSGEVGTVRGNWSAKTNSWDKPNIGIAHHSLEDYTLVGGEPTQRKDIVLSDHKSHTRPFASSRQLEARFYQDLGQCQIAMFFTHAGKIQDALQLARGIDVWVKLGNADYKLGTGNTRHLFFYGCSTMGAIKEHGEDHAPFSTLFDEWMPARYVNGLRTVCGVDGLEVSGNVDGWHFFSRYNKGDSISDAYTLGSLDGFNGHCPVTISYGSTQDDALATLADGRFSSEAALPTWAFASMWEDVPNG